MLAEELTSQTPSLNWLVILEPNRCPPEVILEEIAGALRSETAFCLCPSVGARREWSVPPGWFYSKRGIRPDVKLYDDGAIIREVSTQEYLQIGHRMRNNLPVEWARAGIDSGIVVAIGRADVHALLLVCNPIGSIGRTPYEVEYSFGDFNLARIIGRVLLTNGVGIMLKGRVEKQMDSPWERDKVRLLREHPGWFVAYYEGSMVALADSLDDLLAALQAKYGPRRKPCEVYEIIPEVPSRRLPGPRGNPKLAP